jgi:hypothetical protein
MLATRVRRLPGQPVRLAVIAAGLFSLSAGCSLLAPSASPTTFPAEETTRPAATQGMPTQMPGSAASPTAIAVTATQEPDLNLTPTACQDRGGFVSDVSIPDNTILMAGETFIKTWRLRNNGTCVWSTQYALAFFGGERMGAPAHVPLRNNVPLGEAVDLSVEMSAPMIAGTHQGFWKLRNDRGQYFGIGPQGDQPFWVKIVVTPAPATLEAGSPILEPAETPSLTPTATESPQPSPTATLP